MGIFQLLSILIRIPKWVANCIRDVRNYNYLKSEQHFK